MSSVQGKNKVLSMLGPAPEMLSVADLQRNGQ